MFKVGQEVVFIGKNPPNKRIISPQYNEIVTISCTHPMAPGNYGLAEYPISKRGFKQFFPSRILKPLDLNFVEEVIKQVELKEELV